jgi:hypothetical protein
MVNVCFALAGHPGVFIWNAQTTAAIRRQRDANARACSIWPAASHGPLRFTGMSQDSFAEALMPPGWVDKPRTTARRPKLTTAYDIGNHLSDTELLYLLGMRNTLGNSDTSSTPSRMPSTSSSIDIPPCPQLTERQRKKSCFQKRWPAVYKFLATPPVKQLNGKALTADGIVGSHQVAFWVPDGTKYPAKPRYTDLTKAQGEEHADPVIRQLFRVQIEGSMGRGEKKRKADAAAAEGDERMESIPTDDEEEEGFVVHTVSAALMHCPNAVQRCRD